MFTYDRIQLPYDNTAVTRIDTLQREGLLTRDLTDILHALRKARNKAVHENYDSESECKILIQMAYSLCEWFMQTYGDWNYQHHDFIMPELENKRVSVTQEEKAAEERQAEELTKQAEQKQVQQKLFLNQSVRSRLVKWQVSALNQKLKLDILSMNNCVK